MATTRPLYTKLTCSSYYHRSKGTTSLPRRRRGTQHRERPIVRSQTGRSTSCAFPPTTTSTPSQPEGTTTLPSLQSILIDDNGTPATWTLGLVFQQAIDRQDRTQVEGRFNYWNHWRYTLDSGLLPLPDKDSSHDDMPCRHTTPLRLPPCRDNDKPTGSSLLANTHLAGPQTSHRAPPSLTPSLDTNDISPGHNPIS